MAFGKNSYNRSNVIFLCLIISLSLGFQIICAAYSAKDIFYGELQNTCSTSKEVGTHLVNSEESVKETSQSGNEKDDERKVLDILKVIHEKVKDEEAKAETNKKSSVEDRKQLDVHHEHVNGESGGISPTPTFDDKNFELNKEENSTSVEVSEKDRTEVKKDVYQTFKFGNFGPNEEKYYSSSLKKELVFKEDKKIGTKVHEVEDDKPEKSGDPQGTGKDDSLKEPYLKQDRQHSPSMKSSLNGDLHSSSKEVTENMTALPPKPEEESQFFLPHGDGGDIPVDPRPENYSGDDTSNDTESSSGALEGEESVVATSEVDVNGSVIIPHHGVLDEALKEKDQLETYSQFAERVTAEKKNGVSGGNGQASNGQTKGPKVKSKNYASTDCGAKFLAANPESSHSHKVINSNKDEYMLNKCTGKIWAVVELCESIRPQKFDIANFELFSNSPKDIFVLGSHRYPTREWTTLGAYKGEEGNREVQSFVVDTQEFFKYVKLEVHSYYGTEFFCPLSLFKIYGLSEFEVIEETEDTEEEQIIEEDAFEETTHEVHKEKQGMIPDVIKSIMNGMLEVIKRGSTTGNMTNEPELKSYTQNCQSLQENFSIRMESCSFAESLNYILACYYDEYLKLMVNPFIAAVIQNTAFCQQLATIICISPQNNDSYVYDSVCNNSYACVMLSPKHILAMCHMHDPTILRDSLGCGADDSRPPENVSTTYPSELDVVLTDENTTKIDPEESKQTFDDKDKSTSAQDTPQKGSVPETEPEIIHLPHIHSKPKSPTKDISKKPKETSVSSEKPSNATVNTPDKSAVQTQDKKKEVKGEKSNVEKVTLGDEAPPSPPGPTPSPAISLNLESRPGSHTNKESIVVRLSNKIKVLEHNMSISSQYLEELSQRYKRQMEDMQRQFNITILALNSTSMTAYERDLYHQKRLESLEGQLEQLSKTVSTLVEEKENLLTSVIEQHLILLFIEVVVMCIVFTLCVRRHRNNELLQMTRALNKSGVACISSDEGGSKHLSSVYAQGEPQGRETPSLSRRRSVDSIHMESETKPKERRLSGQVSVAGPYEELLITETTTKEKKRKKKKSNLKRSLSNASIPDKGRSSSAPNKKEKKLEKLKRSSAGVLFSGEDGSQKGCRFARHHSMVEGIGELNRVEEISDSSWRIVRKSRSKAKNYTQLPLSGEYDDVLASDLKRGKITIDEEVPYMYQPHYYTDIPFDQGYTIYDRDYLDTRGNGYKESISLGYEVNGNHVYDPLYAQYSQDVDYTAPVINDYYNSVGQRPSTPRNVDSLKGTVHGDSSEARFIAPDKLPKSLTKTSALSEFPSLLLPSSLKGKTRLRSDNWEWYSSQPSRLLTVSASGEVVSNSSSDSSVRSKQVKMDTKENYNDPRKVEKKKKKKSKGVKPLA